MCFHFHADLYCNLYVTVWKGKVYSEKSGSFVENHFLKNYLNKCVTCRNYLSIPAKSASNVKYKFSYCVDQNES